MRRKIKPEILVHKVAEYLISLGINTIEHYEDPKVLLDIEAL